MLGLIVRRLATLVPLLLIVSFAVFALVYLLPGDPAVTMAGGVNADPAHIEEIREEFGLNDPLLVQYGRWLGDAVQLEFGESLVNGERVADQLTRRFPITFGLALSAIVIGLLVGVPAGIVAGMRPGSIADRIGVLGASLGIAIPNFWMAMILVAMLAVRWKVLPALGYVGPTESVWGWFTHIIMPALALGLWAAASLARQLRAALVDVLESAYVRTAWAKGGSAWRVIGKHALKNAAIPAVTIIGLQLATLLGGAVIMEQIFAIPGLGSYILDGILSFDIPVIQGVVVLFIVVHVLLNLLVDISYGWLNPKVRVT